MLRSRWIAGTTADQMTKVGPQWHGCGRADTEEGESKNDVRKNAKRSNIHSVWTAHSVALLQPLQR